MKFNGNERHFERNAQIDSIFDRLTSANVPENKNLTNLIVEGKELIRKRKKLIRIADKSADGWRVVDEYVSDELASGSEDEKRGLKRAKDAANRKRRQATQARHGQKRESKPPFRQQISSFFAVSLRLALFIYLFFCVCVCFARFLLFLPVGVLCLLSIL